MKYFLSLCIVMAMLVSCNKKQEQNLTGEQTQTEHVHGEGCAHAEKHEGCTHEHEHECDGQHAEKKACVNNPDKECEGHENGEECTHDHAAE